MSIHTNTAEVIELKNRQDNKPVSKELPSPKTPSYCDLTDYPFMPLDINRFLGSEFLAEVDPEAGFYAMQLWAKSWHEVPAGSLPDNDKVLAKIVGLRRDMKTFADLKSDMLYGWVLCSDGRYYHPAIAERALESFVSKILQRLKSGMAIAKRWGNEFDARELSLQLDYAFELLKKSNPCSKAVISGIPSQYKPCSFGIEDVFVKNTSGIPDEYQVKVSKVNNKRDTATGVDGNQKEVDLAFDYFWEKMKTRKVNKKEAKKAFAKLAKGKSKEDLRAFLLMILRDQAKRISDVGEGEHPFKGMHPATYLNGQRWEDEPEKPWNASKPEKKAALTIPRLNYESSDELVRWAEKHGFPMAEPGDSAGSYHARLTRILEERNNG